MNHCDGRQTLMNAKALPVEQRTIVMLWGGGELTARSIPTSPCGMGSAGPAMGIRQLSWRPARLAAKFPIAQAPSSPLLAALAAGRGPRSRRSPMTTCTRTSARRSMQMARLASTLDGRPLGVSWVTAPKRRAMQLLIRVRGGLVIGYLDEDGLVWATPDRVPGRRPRHGACDVHVSGKKCCASRRSRGPGVLDLRSAAQECEHGEHAAVRAVEIPSRSSTHPGGPCTRG